MIFLMSAGMSPKQVFFINVVSISWLSGNMIGGNVKYIEVVLCCYDWTFVSRDLRWTKGVRDRLGQRMLLFSKSWLTEDEIISEANYDQSKRECLA